MKKITLFLVIILALVFANEYITRASVIHVDNSKNVVVDNRAQIIDNYFAKRNMPLEGYGQKMVEVADANGLDWKLLPAISIRETSGGKHMCRKNNPFGWGSCKIEFKTMDLAIETVGYKLANMSVYKGKTTERKLYHYNGTVVPTYPKEVLAIMNSIK